VPAFSRGTAGHAKAAYGVTNCHIYKKTTQLSVYCDDLKRGASCRPSGALAWQSVIRLTFLLRKDLKQMRMFLTVFEVFTALFITSSQLIADDHSSAGLTDQQRLTLFRNCIAKDPGNQIDFAGIFNVITDVITANLPNFGIDVAGGIADAIKTGANNQGCGTFLSDQQLNFYFPPPGTPGHAHQAR
jgi:hypothetical protein